MDIQVIQRLLTDDSIDLMISLRTEPYNTVGVCFQVDEKTFGISQQVRGACTLADKIDFAHSGLARLLLEVILDDDASKDERSEMSDEICGILHSRKVVMI